MAHPETSTPPRGDNPTWTERLLSSDAGITLRRLALIPPAPNFHSNDRNFAIGTFDHPRKNQLDVLAETLTKKNDGSIQPVEAPQALPNIGMLIDQDLQVDYYLKFAVIAGTGNMDSKPFFEQVYTIAAKHSENRNPQAISVLRRAALARIQLGDTAPEAFKDVDAELDKDPKDFYSALEWLIQGEDVIDAKLDSGDNAGAIKTYEMMLKKDESNGTGDLFDAETMSRIEEARQKLRDSETSSE